jgi:hypothetical protein
MGNSKLYGNNIIHYTTHIPHTILSCTQHTLTHSHNTHTHTPSHTNHIHKHTHTHTHTLQMTLGQ